LFISYSSCKFSSVSSAVLVYRSLFSNGFPLKIPSNMRFLSDFLRLPTLLSFYMPILLSFNVLSALFIFDKRFGLGESTTGFSGFFSDLKVVFSANLDARCDVNSCLVCFKSLSCSMRFAFLSISISYYYAAKCSCARGSGSVIRKLLSTKGCNFGWSKVSSRLNSTFKGKFWGD
jgi:hypothetical protein